MDVYKRAWQRWDLDLRPGIESHFIQQDLQLTSDLEERHSGIFERCQFIGLFVPVGKQKGPILRLLEPWGEALQAGLLKETCEPMWDFSLTDTLGFVKNIFMFMCFLLRYVCGAETVKFLWLF